MMPGVPNTVTQTIKQKVPANPTKTLMNMNQPGFLERLGTGIGEQWSNLWDGSVAQTWGWCMGCYERFIKKTIRRRDASEDREDY